ncbi:MAG: hypothetical protein WEA10_09090 [Actinomycetota bacterium]
MRRATFITLIVLFVVLAAAAISQIVIASGDRAPLPGPREPGDLPTVTATAGATTP